MIDTRIRRPDNSATAHSPFIRPSIRRSCAKEITPASLLEQLRPPTDQKAWKRLVKLYTPLLYAAARQLGLQDSDAADLVQNVFLVLVHKLPEFRYDRDKSFRGWLRTILLNKWRESKRRSTVVPVQATDAALNQLAGSDLADLFAETEYRHHVVHRALQLMQAEFEPATWKACWECVVAGRPAADVASELGLSVNAVYLAKSRVLRRLHQDLTGLLD
jgi:RNA polymerase sigma-70 factor (ECF subfamily)